MWVGTTSFMSSQSFSQLIIVNLQYNGIKITKQCSDVNCVKTEFFKLQYSFESSVSVLCFSWLNENETERECEWKAFYFEQSNTHSNSKNIYYALTSNKIPCPMKLLELFEKDLFKIVEKIKFRKINCEF